MDGIAARDTTERAEIFQATASKLGMVEAAVEKDFWVCWVLKQLFESPEIARQVLFKGGTTLSKCFNLIERFSEDIDLILDWTVLTDEDPYAERSNTQQDAFNKHLDILTQNYIREVMLALVSKVVSTHCQASLHPDKYHSIILRYPMAFDSKYIKPEIELEFGAMSAMEPNSNFRIQSYCADVFPQLFTTKDLGVNAIEAKKTFWDKVTILHATAHRSGDRPFPARYSRHYYDLYKMINSSVQAEAMADLPLLIDIVKFKNKFYPQGWANYPGAISGTFKLLPEDEIRRSLISDYEQMKEMIFGEYPTFDEILSSIAEFEIILNGASKSD